MREQKITKQVLDAERLVALSGGITPPPAVGLDESLPISADERLAWERRLNRCLNSCGCVEGGVGLFVGIAIASTAYFKQSDPWPVWETFAVVALPLALLVGGKLVGLRLNRLRFRRVCRRLLSRIAVDIVHGDHQAQIQGD